MNLTDKLRAAMREAGTPMTRRELADVADIEADTISKLLYAGKTRGEFCLSVLDGKPAYALNPDYVPGRKSRGGGRPRQDGAPTPAPTAPAPAAPPSPAPAAPDGQPQATPGEVLNGFALSASAMADETLERAVRIPVAPGIILQLTHASRALHQAALALTGGTR